MATERLQFHEMGIDDRILKVTNWLTLSGNRERAVYEGKLRRGAGNSARTHGGNSRLC